MLQLQIVSFRKGSYLVVEGKENTDHFYIIQKGNVQCMKSSGSGLAPTMYGPGDFVGVVPCMSDHLQIETAIATTDVMAISVRKDQYPELISQNTPVALKIIKTFANRMRVMNEMLTKATLHSVVQDTYEQIFKVGNFYEKNALPDVAVYAYYQYLKTKPQGPNADLAKQKFVTLKPKTHAVYFEPTTEPTRQYPKDTMIFSEAQTGSDMFIIQRGEVSITKIVNGNEVTLAVLKKGDMFGEMALIENKPRSANALAHSDCTLMVINRSNFNQMVATQPQLIAKLTTTLADRLWSMYRQLDNATLTEPLAKMLDMLSLQLEKQRVKIGFSKLSMQTEFTPKDLANMCGLASEYQAKAIYDFEQYDQIRIENGKIFIKDAQELMKAAAFYRKQNK
ncbi:cyclic nucleotide-binding protein [Treponema bryantii]|uniref:Cyclic nucleotide-binding protein n=1 Tax=Treponema bryantii TaxID=163 RepID=A0A1H9CHP7_9SPIR|nr:cyclic nucleotide-binding domain-containing protein [Treponema bryantii]SEQ00253.1 cyclic nucleotide-binding protein [Treponema bryantii]